MTTFSTKHPYKHVWNSRVIKKPKKAQLASWELERCFSQALGPRTPQSLKAGGGARGARGAGRGACVGAGALQFASSSSHWCLAAYWVSDSDHEPGVRQTGMLSRFQIDTWTQITSSPDHSWAVRSWPQEDPRSVGLWSPCSSHFLYTIPLRYYLPMWPLSSRRNAHCSDTARVRWSGHANPEALVRRK